MLKKKLMPVFMILAVLATLCLALPAAADGNPLTLKVFLGDPADQHGRLSASGARENKKRPFGIVYRLPLCGIQIGIRKSEKALLNFEISSSDFVGHLGKVSIGQSSMYFESASEITANPAETAETKAAAIRTRHTAHHPPQSADFRPATKREKPSDPGAASR